MQYSIKESKAALISNSARCYKTYLVHLSCVQVLYVVVNSICLVSGHPSINLSCSSDIAPTPASDPQQTHFSIQLMGVGRDGKGAVASSWSSKFSYFDHIKRQNFYILTIQVFKIRVLPLLKTKKKRFS